MLPFEQQEFLRELVESGMSYAETVRCAELNGIKVSPRTVSNIANCRGKIREAMKHGQVFKQTRLRPARTPAVIKRIEKMIIGEDPQPLKRIAIRLAMSRRTVGRVVHEDLGLVKRRKRKVHALNESNIENRKTNAPKLYRRICGSRAEYSVSLDEAMFYYIPGDYTADVVYLKKGQVMPSKYVKQVNVVQAPHAMVVAGMSGRGPIKARVVPPKTKIDATYYIKHVLQPIIEKELPKLYPGEMNKVFLHHDKATSHMAKKTMNFLESMHQKYGITFQPKHEVVVKGADVSPMDFFGFWWLEKKMQDSKCKSFEGFCRAIPRRWSKLPMESCVRVFKAWKRRCLMVKHMSGKHIEQVANIHLHKK